MVNKKWYLKIKVGWYEQTITVLENDEVIIQLIPVENKFAEKNKQ